MSNEKGWVKLSRGLIDSAIFTDEKTLKIWVWCLLKAAYHESDTIINGSVVHLNKGQFIFGVHAASNALSMSVKCIRTRMLALEKLGMISRKPTNKFTIITICDWEQMQCEEPKKRGSKQYGLGYYRGQQDAKNEPAKAEDKIQTKSMLTIKEATEYSGLSYNAIRQMCLQNKITHIKVGNKYLINKEKFAEYLQTGEK